MTILRMYDNFINDFLFNKIAFKMLFGNNICFFYTHQYQKYNFFFQFVNTKNNKINCVSAVFLKLTLNSF